MKCVRWRGDEECAKFTLHCIRAVSYTHLDVYKRQGQYRPEKQQIEGNFRAQRQEAAAREVWVKFGSDAASLGEGFGHVGVEAKTPVEPNA